MKKTTLAFLFLSSVSTQAFILNETYLTGAEVCQVHQSRIISEFSKMVEVPVDYAKPELEKTQIYAYTKKEFDANLPSLLFFTGGPGDSSRNNEFSLPNFNVIYFEQRGISCSRPERRELFLDPKFYSSLNTARDAQKIVQAFGLKKVTVLGHSYGTVPATIFSSLFPDQVRALLLEGVVYHADRSLWLSTQRNHMLQTIFDAFPAETQNKILALSAIKEIPASWFSYLGNRILQYNNGMEAYRVFVTEVLSNEYLDLKTYIPGYFTDPKRPEEEFLYGDVTTGMIACQEMGMANPRLSLTTVFSDKKLVRDPFNFDREINCRPLGLENNKSKPYFAKHYPVSVPVAYLLGHDDPATPLDQGLRHHQNVARGFKRLLIMEHGGHRPSLSLLQENWDCKERGGGCDSIRQNKVQVKIIEQLAMGKERDTEDLKDLVREFNKAGPMKWDLR